MWNKFEASSIEDETVASSFLTAGLFKILNEEVVRQLKIPLDLVWIML